MEDFVKTGLGAVESDAVIRSIVQKPIWHLVPLPISQINPSATKPLFIRGQIPTLKSSCLSVASKNLHLYTVELFKAIPPVFIQRIISRIRNDRQYEDDFTAYTEHSTYNPDEGTIWALSALLDPEGTLEKNAGSFQLSLPQESVLNHLTPNNLLKYPDHPLVELPKLYNTLHTSSNVSLLTSLTLDGMDEFVNDHNIQPLKYCTNLTALWFKRCRITDMGVRLLTSSLELPEQGKSNGRGLCKLRSWGVGGCRGISDKSMNSFARYPGLVMLDIRETSCTSSAIDIFNRVSQNLFSEQNPDFQPCTDGLLDLFTRNTTSADIVDQLCLTLIRLPHASETESKAHVSLNIVPSHRPLDPRYLPESSRTISTDGSPLRRTWEAPDAKTVYRGNGVGQIYGTSVSRVDNEVKDFRERRKLAIELTEKENQAIREAEAYEQMGSNERRAFTRRKNKELKEDREWNWKYKYGKTDEEDRTGAYKKAGSKTYKQRGKKGDAERSKSFVMGNKGQQVLIDRVAKDDRSLMLVRMVNDDWENLKWTVNTGSTGFAKNLDGTGTGTAKKAAPGFALSQSKMKASNLVEDLLSTTMTVISPSQSQPQSQSQSQSPSRSQSHSRSTYSFSQSQSSSTFNSSQDTPQRPSQGSISSSPLPFSSSQDGPKRNANPFKSQKTKSNAMGVRPLSASSSSSTLIRPLSASQPNNDSTIARSPFANSGISGNPFNQSINRNSSSQPSGDVGSKASGSVKKTAEEFSFFSGGPKKRTFEGIGGDPANKRSGMKMFSIGSQRRENR
ncbi:uncharacterized protein I303_106585 [Kwoniella dejecticola CBS 10117]|uniref:Uncharacterized protein n=1 Tax=Kwoniella dejecticola CBS 10117 TaxID=1296121 RepID=A0AAJ8MJG3_9TREE